MAISLDSRLSDRSCTQRRTPIVRESSHGRQSPDPHTHNTAKQSAPRRTTQIMSLGSNRPITRDRQAFCVSLSLSPSAQGYEASKQARRQATKNAVEQASQPASKQASNQTNTNKQVSNNLFALWLLFSLSVCLPASWLAGAGWLACWLARLAGLLG